MHPKVGDSVSLRPLLGPLALQKRALSLSLFVVSNEVKHCALIDSPFTQNQTFCTCFAFFVWRNMTCSPRALKASSIAFFSRGSIRSALV